MESKERIIMFILQVRRSGLFYVPFFSNQQRFGRTIIAKKNALRKTRGKVFLSKINKYQIPLNINLCKKLQ